MRKLLLLLPFFLPGCAAITDLLAPAYTPQPIHIYSPAQYAADELECKTAGANFKPQASIGTLITKTVDGATSNTSLIPISPMVPFYGAAGGLAQGGSDALDVASGQHANVFRNCLHDETLIDHSAVLADPRG